jgi:ribosomal-protein-serine acetyltransferase
MPPCHGGDRRFESGRARQVDIVPLLWYYFFMSQHSEQSVQPHEIITIPTSNENVVLRELSVADAPAYFNAWTASVEDIARYDPETRGKYPTVESVEDSMKQTGRIRMGIWDKGEFVGSTSLRPMQDDDKVMEIGYWVDSRHTGKGYASLAAKAMSNYASTRFPIVRAEVMDENTASVRILEKSGYTRTSKRIGEFAVFELTK